MLTVCGCNSVLVIVSRAAAEAGEGRARETTLEGVMTSTAAIEAAMVVATAAAAAATAISAAAADSMILPDKCSSSATASQLSAARSSSLLALRLPAYCITSSTSALEGAPIGALGDAAAAALSQRRCGGATESTTAGLRRAEAEDDEEDAVGEPPLSAPAPFAFACDDSIRGRVTKVMVVPPDGRTVTIVAREGEKEASSVESDVPPLNLVTVRRPRGIDKPLLLLILLLLVGEKPPPRCSRSRAACCPNREV